MEYPEAENLVFSSAIAGVKNVLGDLTTAIVALIAIFVIMVVLKVLIGVFFEWKNEDEFGEDYKIARGYRERMSLGGVEGDIYRRKYNVLIRKMSEKD